MLDAQGIGKRIATAREDAGYKKTEAGEALNISRQTLSTWEKGSGSPNVSDLVRLCKLFHCDFGYIVGEYEGKTRTATDIHEKTGLTYKSIGSLEIMKEKNQWCALHGLNTLLEEEACNTLDLIGQYLFNPETDTILPNGERVPTKSIIMIAIQRSLDRIGRQYQ